MQGNEAFCVMSCELRICGGRRADCERDFLGVCVPSVEIRRLVQRQSRPTSSGLVLPSEGYLSVLFVAV